MTSFVWLRIEPSVLVVDREIFCAIAEHLHGCIAYLLATKDGLLTPPVLLCLQAILLAIFVDLYVVLLNIAWVLGKEARWPIGHGEARKARKVRLIVLIRCPSWILRQVVLELLLLWIEYTKHACVLYQGL